MLKILIIDDEKISRLKIKSNLIGHELVEASTFDEAITALDQKFDLCFIDLNLDNSGVELLGFELLKLTVQKGIYSIIMSSLHDDEIIEHAYEIGCNDYYSKGNEKASIADTLNRFFIKKNDYLENYFLKEVFSTKSIQQKELIKKIIPVIQTTIPICILGESGTGKTFLAREIHEQSKRVGEFVEVNCAALSEELLESELFGHAKGAFTGAVTDTKGKLALANNGTLFLDEIGSMSKGLQSKLLKVIEEKTYYQVNSDKLLKSDFRILSATLDNLEQKILAGEFRFDLYQRLCGLTVELLPLRSRREDILDLFKKEQSNTSESGRKVVFTKDAKNILENYRWPGNMRELKRFYQMVSIEGTGLISAEHVNKLLKNPSDNLSKNKKLISNDQFEFALKIGLPEFLEKIENEVIQSAFSNNNNGVRKTLTQLKINQAKLYKYTRASNEGVNEVQ